MILNALSVLIDSIQVRIYCLWRFALLFSKPAPIRLILL